MVIIALFYPHLLKAHDTNPVQNLEKDNNINNDKIEVVAHE